MKEYIEREALLELYQIDGPENETGHVPLPVIRQNIMDIPAADVAEVRHGRWEEVRDAYGKLEGWLCECGREVKSKDNYCPNCGARMDKEDEHETG